jgi:hypothetical protein
MIRQIEENQRGVFFRVEFAAMEKALTVKSGLSNGKGEIDSVIIALDSNN